MTTAQVTGSEKVVLLEALVSGTHTYDLTYTQTFNTVLSTYTLHMHTYLPYILLLSAGNDFNDLGGGGCDPFCDRGGLVAA